MKKATQKVSVSYDQWVLGSRLISKTLGTEKRLTHADIYAAGIKAMKEAGRG